jgi:hypothetical protein
MDNAQNCDSYTNIPSSQTCRSHRVNEGLVSRGWVRDAQLRRTETQRHVTCALWDHVKACDTGQWDSTPFVRLPPHVIPPKLVVYNSSYTQSVIYIQNKVLNNIIKINKGTNVF